MPDDLSPRQKERYRAVENALMVVIDALIRHGADETIVGNDYMRGRWVKGRVDKLALVHGEAIQ